MVHVSSACYENMKRYWRRKRYHRLKGGKRKLKITRLGGATPRLWKPRTTPNPNILHYKIFSPIKIFSKFHNAYIDMMIRLTTKMGELNDNGLFRGKKVAKDQQISMLSGGEEVDSRLVLEIYKRLAASHELNVF